MGIVSYLAIHGRLRKLVTGIQPRIFLSNRHSPVGIPRPIRAPVGSSFLWTLSSLTYRKNLFVYLASRMSYPWADKLTRVHYLCNVSWGETFSLPLLSPPPFLSWQGNNSEYESWRVRNAWTRGGQRYTFVKRIDSGEKRIQKIQKCRIIYRGYKNIFKLDEVRRRK